MIVVDIETTGMEPDRHSIVSIGAMEYENPENRFYKECRMDEDRKIDKKSFEINGFTKKEVTDKKKPTVKELLEDFTEWTKKIKERTIAGDNIWFDIGFLEYNFEEKGIKSPFKKEYVELHELTPLLKEMPWSLDIVLNMVGVPPRDGTHNALDDVELTAEAIARITTGDGLLQRFAKYPLSNRFRKKK